MPSIEAGRVGAIVSSISEQDIEDAKKEIEYRKTASQTDCRTDDGVTVGLIDSIIMMARVLRGRDQSSPEVQEALEDLREDEDIFVLLNR